MPLGYQKDDQGQLVPSPDAPVIQRIFELYGTRVYSYTDIADELNAQGFRTLNWRTGERNLFGRESIRTILRNKAYLGFVSSGGVEYPGKHPPLISTASWETAEALRRERTSASGKSSVRGPAVGGLLTEITYCWKCGARMWYHYSGRAGKRGMYYVCGGRSRRTCDSSFCNATAVEEQLLAVAQALTLPQEWRDAVAQTVNRLLQRPTDPRINRPAIEEKLRRLKRVYLEGDLDDATYQAERSRLQ